MKTAECGKVQFYYSLTFTTHPIFHPEVGDINFETLWILKNHAGYVRAIDWLLDINIRHFFTIE